MATSNLTIFFSLRKDFVPDLSFYNYNHGLRLRFTSEFPVCTAGALRQAIFPRDFFGLDDGTRTIHSRPGGRVGDWRSAREGKNAGKQRSEMLIVRCVNHFMRWSQAATVESIPPLIPTAIVFLSG